MKKTFSFIAVLLCCMSMTLNVSAAKKRDCKATIAAFVTTNLCPETIEDMETELNQWISKVPRFRVLNREESGMEAVMKELDIQRSGLVSDSQIKKIGKMCGAQYVIDAKVRRTKSVLKMTARIINIETGEIVYSTNLQRTVYSRNPDWSEELVQLAGMTGQKIWQEFKEC